jgi:DNA-binding SARP family transcriptional activator
MTALDARVLGPFEIRRDGRPVPTGRSKQRDLLALLASRAPRAVSVDLIIDELWRSEPPPSARKVIQKHVSELRQLLGRDHVASVSGGYALRDVGIDADRFETAFTEARFTSAPMAAERLRAALALWAGEAYDDVELDALVPVRTRLNELRLAAVERLNEARLALGEHTALIADLERLIADHPSREALWGQLMRALYAAGRQADALRAFQRLRVTLAREVGIEPSGELRQLEQRILAQEALGGPAAVEPSGAAGPSDVQRRVMTIVAVDLGGPSDADPEHRARSMRALHERIAAWCAPAGGALESAMGSRVLIAFGAPAHEDDADRALHLAHHIVTQLPSAKASLATGWALVQPDAERGTHIVGSVVEVACSALAWTASGHVHVDHSTTAARVGVIDDPPFVGRQRELALAAGLLTRTLSGYGPQAIVIRGEPGFGKTRLVQELARTWPAGATWLHARCTDGAPPSAPLATIVRDHIGLAGSAAPAEWRDGFDRLLATLLADEAEREWVRRCIGPVVVASPIEHLTERSEIVAAWAAYLSALARHGPAVIVFDDVHRTDVAFDALLTDCFRQLRETPILVVSTARTECPERSFQWVGADSLTLNLRGLDAAETDELLAHLLNDDPVTEAQRALIRTRSCGNPLYALHFARMLRQQGWSGSIPDSTCSLIAARLDLLAPLEQAMVFAGAVADQPFPIAQLATMHGVDEGAATVAVERLVDKALFVGAGRDALAFSHDLVREVASEQLVRSRRARLHEAAAAWIEQRAGDGIARDAMRVANHLAAAAAAQEEDGQDTTELRDHAFRMMIAASDRLQGLGAEEIATRLADAVEAGHAPADVAELNRQRAAALARIGRLNEAADAALAGLEAARHVNDRAREARLGAIVGEVHWLRGDTSSCVRALEAAMSSVAGLPADRAVAEAVATLAFITALSGRPDEAVALAERGLVLAREYGMAAKEVRCLNARGAARLLQGDLKGYNDFMRALTRALEAGLGHETVMAYHNLAELQLQGVGTASSAELNQHGLELAERRGLALAADWLRANRVQVFFEAGRWDEALAVVDQVLAAETQSGPGHAGTACGVYCARIHVWRGQVERARQLMHDFLPRARQHAVIQQLGPALIVAGLVETASGRPEAGAAYADEYCDLTAGALAYRHMEVADLVRLLVAAAQPERAAAAADNDAIPAIRNQCHSMTASATLAAAGEGAALFEQAAEKWRAYGHPLEEYLALVSAAAIRGDGGPGERSQQLRSRLGISTRSVAALCPAVSGVLHTATRSRPIRNRPASPSSWQVAAARRTTKGMP